MIVLGLDPGTRESALVIYNGVSVMDHWILSNEDLLVRLTDLSTLAAGRHEPYVLVIEHIAMGGMIAGQEVFESCHWAGRFHERWHPRRVERLKRIPIKLHLCGQARARDANIRQALLDRFGGETAQGTKKAPGPLYGIKSHEWAALAVAVTWFDQNGHTDPVRPGIEAQF